MIGHVVVLDIGVVNRMIVVTINFVMTYHVNFQLNFLNMNNGIFSLYKSITI